MIIIFYLLPQSNSMIYWLAAMAVNGSSQLSQYPVRCWAICNEIQTPVFHSLLMLNTTGTSVLLLSTPGHTALVVTTLTVWDLACVAQSSHIDVVVSHYHWASVSNQATMAEIVTSTVGQESKLSSSWVAYWIFYIVNSWSGRRTWHPCMVHTHCTCICSCFWAT